MTIYGLHKFSGMERDIIRKHLPILRDAELIKRASGSPFSAWTLNEDNTLIGSLLSLFAAANLLNKENSCDKQSYRPFKQPMTAG